MFTATGVHAETGLHFTNLLRNDGISVLTLAAFEAYKFQPTALTAIRRAGIRVVFLVASSGDTRAVGNTGITLEGGWAWLIFERRRAVLPMVGWLFIESARLSEGTDTFARQVSDYTKSHFNLTLSPDSVDVTYSVALHAAIMLYAHGVTRVLSEGDDLRDGEAVTAAIRNTSFVGVSGTTVSLDSHGDRIESYEVMNYVLEAGGVVSSVAVGVFNATLQEYSAYERAVIWPGSRMEVPVDHSSGAAGVQQDSTSTVYIACPFLVPPCFQR